MVRFRPTVAVSDPLAGGSGGGVTASWPAVEELLEEVSDLRLDRARPVVLLDEVETLVASRYSGEATETVRHPLS